jgi:hypothetical protein
MNNRLIRFLSLLLQILVIGTCLAACVYGIMISEETSDSNHYLASTARVVILLLLTISYYKTSMTSFDPGNIFMILALLFLSVSELRILSYFSAMTGWGIIPPRIGVRIQMFSQFMAYLSIAGFGLYYQNTEQVNTSAFCIMGTLGTLFLSILLPATQDMDGIWTLLAPKIILGVIAATAFIVMLILLFNEQTSSGIMRFIGLILIMGGNLITIFFGAGFLYYAIGSAVYFLGGFVLMLSTLRNSVIL